MFCMKTRWVLTWTLTKNGRLLKGIYLILSLFFFNNVTSSYVSSWQVINPMEGKIQKWRWQHRNQYFWNIFPWVFPQCKRRQLEIWTTAGHGKQAAVQSEGELHFMSQEIKNKQIAISTWNCGFHTFQQHITCVDSSRNLCNYALWSNCSFMAKAGQQNPSGREARNALSSESAFQPLCFNTVITNIKICNK